MWLLYSCLFSNGVPVFVVPVRLHHNSLGLDRGFSFAEGIWLFLTFPQRLDCLLSKGRFLFPSTSFHERLRCVAVLVFLTSSVQFTAAPSCHPLQSRACTWTRKCTHQNRRNWCHLQTLAAPPRDCGDERRN